VLPEQTYAQDRVNRKLVLDYSYLATLTSGTPQAVVPTNALGASAILNPAVCIIGRMIYKVVTPFTSSGGAITTFTLSFGDGGSGTRFLNAIDLKTAAVGVYGAQTNGIFLYTVADTLDITATIAGQTMASLNAGQVEIAFELNDPSGLWTIQQP
jgi:hypothetical protein